LELFLTPFQFVYLFCIFSADNYWLTYTN
jgi:hypothetical protein